MKSLLREPLLHFFLIGLSLFVLYHFTGSDQVTDNKIVIDPGRIENLSAVFSATWNRPPTDDELNGLVDNYVIEEILYRQALNMGMDKDDPMIRRRLRQKMEFLTMEALDLYQASEQDLTEYLNNHPDKFMLDPVFSFQQIYLNTDTNTANLNAKIERIQHRIEIDQPIIGDQSMLPGQMTEAPAFAVNRSFGEGFAEHLSQLPLNQWHGPIRSGLGLHFVKLDQVIPGRLPQLAEVREQVLREWQNDKNKKAKTALLDNLRSHYDVVIDWPRGVGKHNGG